MPSGAYEWTATRVDIIVPQDDESREQLALAFFSGIGVDGLGIGNLKKFSKAGYKTIPDILSMTMEDILKIDGFKEKSATKIYNGLQELKRDNFSSVPLAKLMGLSGVFGRGMGERKANEVLKKYPNIVTQDLTESELTQLIMSVPGFSTKTATQFSEGIAKFKQFAHGIGIDLSKETHTPITRSTSTDWYIVR